MLKTKQNKIPSNNNEKLLICFVFIFSIYDFKNTSYSPLF